jgi:hypothetical protein
LAHGFVHGYLWEPTSRGGITLVLAKKLSPNKIISNKKLPTEMTRLLFSFLLFCTCVAEMIIPAGFRKIGYLANRLSYGHMHLLVDLTKIDIQHSQAKKMVEVVYYTGKMAKLDNKTPEGVSKPLLRSIKKSFRPEDILIKQINTVFQTHHIEKRQLVIAIAGVTSVFSIGMSMYNI